ncbi:MAG: SpoIIE family protein phosphatase [Bacteroidales bacterium]|nr:SpoIIE family protein phosphatase [Bacteroidales bacterium]
MKKGLLLIVFLLISYLTASSQINRLGTPMISWSDAAETPGDLINLCITMDKRGVMYFGNESSGIVTYDGTLWGLIPMLTPQRVGALATDHRGVVFAGGDTDFGFLQPDLAGRLTYNSLAGRIADSTYRSEIGPILSIASDSNTVFFSDGMRLYLLDIATDSVSVTDMEREYGLKNVSRMLTLNDRTVLADEREGLFEYREGRISRLPGGEKIRMVQYAGLLRYDNDNILVATEEGGLVLLNHRSGALNTQFLSRADNNRLRRGPLKTVALLPGGMIAAGLSESGGLLIFSREGRLLQYISDETTSIRESSVTSMYCDYESSSQLWFCTRGFINRAYISLPAYEFGSASGIGSIISGVTALEDSVFVSTEHGLYKRKVDNSGVVRFRRMEEPAAMIYDILGIHLPERNVMMAAASDGLWQTDNDGYVTQVLSRVHLTAIRSALNDSTVLLAAADDGMVRTLKYASEEWKVINTCGRGELKGRVKEIEHPGGNEWWILTSLPSSLMRMQCDASDTVFIRYDKKRGIECDTLNNIFTIDGGLYVCSGRGIWRYNRESDIFEKDHDLIGNTFDNVLISNLFKTPDGDIFLTGFDTRNFDALVTTTSQGHVVFRRQFDFLPDIATTGISYIDGNIWITKGRSIFIIDKSKLGFSYGTFTTFFTRITSGDASVLMDGSFYSLSPEGTRIPSAIQPGTPDVSLRHSRNSISLRWTTTSYVGEAKTEYRYRMDGFDDDWSRWEKRTYRDYTNLPSGDYTFRLKAKTITGLESEETTYSFSVRKPWYTSIVAVLLYIMAAAGLIFYIVRYFAGMLKVRNQRLESLMKQRSEVAGKAREEIAALVRYAGYVQRALMPSEKILIDALRNSFILNRPKDRVSGDFYWMTRKGDKFFIAVGDCTGHGVNSALTTLMGLSFLDEIGNRQVTLKTSVIVSEFQRKMITAQQKHGIPESMAVSINIALLAIDRNSGSVEFSGVGSQCYRVREMSDEETAKWKMVEMDDDTGILADGKYLLEIIYGDRLPDGVQPRASQEYLQYEWNLEKDTSYYLFTDGYADQFSGVTGKKFMKKNFRKLILDVQNYPMSKQEEMLRERLDSWIGSAPQTDDILVVGFKIE